MTLRILSVLSCLLLVSACSTLPTPPAEETPPVTEVPAASASAPAPSRHFWPFTHTGSAGTTTRAAPSKPAVSEEDVARPAVATIDLTAQPDDLWARIRRGFGMQNLYNANVERQLAAFQAHPQAVANTLERGRKYLYHIVTELEKRGMPTELALLPLVESSFNPLAFSPAKAAGLWQFIPSTGRDFQLEQNWWVDERRDILASTDAALTYLQAVYELQGDWHLALASYNWGENAVLRAVNNNLGAGRPTDFNSLRMPAETSQYVPKLQAIKMIVANPDKYGVKLPSIPNEPYFVTVERSQGIDLALAAKLAEMPLADFIALNPAYNRPVIPGSHDSDLILPIRNAQRFKENLAAHGGPLVSWKTYSLPRAERVEQVAQRLRLSADALRRTNSLPAGARLAAGYTLLVPQDTDLSVPPPAPVAAKSRATPGKKAGTPAPRQASKASPKQARKATPKTEAKAAPAPLKKASTNAATHGKARKS